MNTASLPPKAGRRLSAQVSLGHRSPSFHGRIAATIAGVLLLSFVPLVLQARVAPGAITGRILNQGTGQ
ncbi:MAG: hypothetical protein HY736_17110 [Verrucomicrobia bacterium]|nr:hypothetical protein [Verrucomicrobiota bacterium]